MSAKSAQGAPEVAPEETARGAGKTTGGSAEEGEPEGPQDRMLAGVPFLFGGVLALFLAYTLRQAPTRTGVPPFWVLFLAVGIIALVAGVLLMLSREPEGEEDDDETIAVPKKEWARVQRELERLRTVQRTSASGEVPPAQASGGPKEHPTSVAPAVGESEKTL